MLTLDELVRNVCEESGDTKFKMYPKFLRLAIRCYRDLGLFVIPTIKSVELPINNNNTVDLPADFIYLNKVGICCGGRIVTLSVDDSLCIPEELCSCADINEEISHVNGCCTGAINPSGTTAFYGWNGGYGELYGLGAGYNCLGYYRFDKENQRLILNSGYPNQLKPTIIVEYKADGTANGVRYVPAEAQETIIAWINYKHFLQSNRGVSESEWYKYTINYDKLIKLYGSMNMEDWHHTVLQTIKSSPKR